MPLWAGWFVPLLLRHEPMAAPPFPRQDFLCSENTRGDSPALQARCRPWPILQRKDPRANSATHDYLFLALHSLAQEWRWYSRAWLPFSSSGLAPLCLSLQQNGNHVRAAGSCGMVPEHQHGVLQNLSIYIQRHSAALGHVFVICTQRYWGGGVLGK